MTTSNEDRADKPPARGKMAQEMRQDEALRLYVIEGLTYTQVAARLKYTKAGAYSAVQAARARHRTESKEIAEHAREMYLLRQKELFSAAMARVYSSDCEARDITAAMHVADRIYRVEGAKDEAADLRVTVAAQIDDELATIWHAIQRAAPGLPGLADAAGP